MGKKTTIEIFDTRNDAFDWVMEKMNDLTVGEITTGVKFKNNDAIIGESDDFIFVGLYNFGSC